MTDQMLVPELDDAREAIERHDWKEAFEILGAADERSPLPPEWLERYAESAWWNGRLDACIDARERSYAAFLAADEPRSAAVVALRIAHNYESKLSPTQESAWNKRAESLLDREPECVEHAHLARRRAARAAAAGSSTRR